MKITLSRQKTLLVCLLHKRRRKRRKQPHHHQCLKKMKETPRRRRRRRRRQPSKRYFKMSRILKASTETAVFGVTTTTSNIFPPKWELKIRNCQYFFRWAIITSCFV